MVWAMGRIGWKRVEVRVGKGWRRGVMSEEVWVAMWEMETEEW